MHMLGNVCLIYTPSWCMRACVYYCVRYTTERVTTMMYATRDKINTYLTCYIRSVV